eukprot:symbB.v1.2.028313.t1/scaffold2956.1/size66508/2
MKWHPDKNQDNQEKAQKKFIEISHAYEVLGDPEKKAKYDRHGEAGLNEGQGGGGHGNAGFQGQDPFEMFRSFFGGGGGPPSCFQHPSIPKFYAIGVMERVKVLPCWESQEVAVRPLKELVSELQLGEGRTNQNFIVDCAASRYFVRLGADLPFYGVSRVREQAAARAAEAAGIAPAVRYTEADVMVVDFVEKSRALTEADLHAAGQEGVKSELLRSVGRSLRQLHATPVPEELEAFLREIGTIGWGGPHLEKWLRYAEEEKYSRLPLLDGLRSLIDQLNRAAGPLGPNKFCHFDLLADNLVLKEDGSILLVDFEYSAPGQPLMDLAVLAMGCSLSSVEEQSLLSAYLDREATEAEGLQFQALRVLAALRETFWGVTAELSQSSALSMEEAVCYTDMNFQKFVELREAKLSTFYGKSGVFKRHVIWSRTQFSFQQGSGIIVWEFAPCPMATSSSNFSCAAGCSRYAWPRKGFRKEPKSSVILEGRIFVSIVAYCDPELPSTILSLLSQSERPDLLYIGLIWQGPETELLLPTTELQKFWTHESHETRLPTVTSLVLPTGTLDISTTHGGHLRVISMPAEDARGPCWARYLAQLLWKKEELYLQLDSHMRFVPLWDRKARRDLLICQQKSQKPVLCCYGRAYQQGLPYDMAPKNLTGCLNCAAFFDAHNILNIRYRSLRHDWDEPRKSYFWSAHFSFSSSECLKEVPYDPRLLMLFFGEEILMTVRFWTHGWDLFSPAQGLIFHLWERDYRRVYAEDMKELYQDLCRSSRRRLHGMLGSGPGAFFYEQPLPWPLPGGCHASGGDPFGLGLERTVADYERCAGVSFSDRRLDAFALRGGADSESAFITQETGEQAVIELQCQSDMQKLQRERGGGGHFQFGGGGGFPGGPSQGGGRSSKGNKLLFQEVPGVQELTSKTWKAEMEEESLRRNRLVLFYESNLPEMQELKDAMTEVGAKLVEGSSLVLAGAVNCGRSETLCQKQGIKKLPEVVYFGPEGEQPNRLITVSVGANLGLLHFFDEVVLNCVLMHMNQPWGPRVGVIFRVLLSLPSLTKAFWFEFENLTLISGWHTVPPYKTSSRTMCDVVDLLEDLLDGPWTVLVQDSPPPRSKTPEPLPPSDDELRQAIKKLLMGKDLSTISLKALRLDLERGFKLPAGGLDSRKGEIRTLAQDLVVEAQNAPPPAPSTPVPVEPAAKKRRTLTQAVPVAPEGALSAPASPVKTKGPRKKARNHDRTTGQREDQCFGSTPPPRDPVANDTS